MTDEIGDWQDRVRQWAEDRNILSGSEPLDQFGKLVEEVNELYEAIVADDEEGIADGIGDASVVLCIMAAQCRMRYSDCLEHAWGEIKDRRGKMVDGVFVKES